METKFEQVVKILKDNHISCTVYLMNHFVKEGQLHIGLGYSWKTSTANKIFKLIKPLGFEQSNGIFDENPNAVCFAADCGGTAIIKKEII